MHYSTVFFLSVHQHHRSNNPAALPGLSKAVREGCRSVEILDMVFLSSHDIRAKERNGAEYRWAMKNTQY